MKQTFDVPASERGKLHLFALNGATREADTPLADELPAVILSIPELDPTYAEIVNLSDLGALELTDYLTEGYDIPAASLNAEKMRLNALEGRVLIVLSLAFRDQPQSIALGNKLTHIATLDTQGTDWTPSDPIKTQSALPGSAPASTIKKRPSNAAMMGRIATFVLLGMFAFTALLIWIAG